MSDIPDPAMREILREDEQIVVELLGTYVVRRDAGEPTRLPELVARAGEFGEAVKLKLIGVVSLYEALRATDDD